MLHRILALPLALYIYLILSAVGCHSSDETKINEVDPEKFEFVRKEPGNELGIFTKIIVNVFRPANQTTEEYRINREFLPDGVQEWITSSCENPEENNSNIKWSGCKSEEDGLFAYATWGVPEPKNKTITYLELNFEAFSKQSEGEEEEVCLLEEVYKTRAYVVLNTFSELPANDSFPRNYVDSVATVHQHQLDAYGENFLDLFGDKIELDDIYNFGKDEYFERDPPYECFLAISSSASKAVIEEKCDFFCLKKSDRSRQEIEKILAEAQKVAREEEESDSDFSDDEDEKLSYKNREEL